MFKLYFSYVLTNSTIKHLLFLECYNCHRIQPVDGILALCRIHWLNELVCPCVYMHVSLYLPVWLSVSVSVCLALCLSLCICLSLSLSDGLAVWLFVCLSVSVCLSVCLCVSVCLCRLWVVHTSALKTACCSPLWTIRYFASSSNCCLDWNHLRPQRLTTLCQQSASLWLWRTSLWCPLTFLCWCYHRYWPVTVTSCRTCCQVSMTRQNLINSVIDCSSLCPTLPKSVLSFSTQMM